MKWVKVDERQPERGGEYAVIRRGRGGTHFPDVCHFTPPVNASGAYWSATGRGPIRSVEQWLEIDEATLQGWYVARLYDEADVPRRMAALDILKGGQA